MTTTTFDAVHENGVFRPLSPPITIAEGQHVRLTIEPCVPEVETRAPEDVLALAAKVYEGLSEDEINEIENIILNRSNFTSDRTTDDL